MARSDLTPRNASTDDDAGLLTTTYSLPLGVSSARTCQLNLLATFTDETDEIIIQVQKGGLTKNLTYTFQDSETGTQQFTSGEYRIVAYLRGFGVTGLRVGLSSTATDIRADISALC